MRKQSGGRRAAPKPKRKPLSVDDYIAATPEPARSRVKEIRAAIRSAVPDASETISYGIPAFKRGRVLVWFAAFAEHCSLFPTASIIEAFQQELKGFPCAKGTIQFPIDKPIPIALIKKLVKARVAQVEEIRHR